MAKKTPEIQKLPTLMDADRGGLRERLKMFTAITNQNTINEVNKHIKDKYSENKKTIPFDRIKESHAKIALLHTLLSSAPPFRDGHFDLTSIYTLSDLTEFIRTCKKLSSYIQGQFNHPLRRDLESKPVFQLQLQPRQLLRLRYGSFCRNYLFSAFK